MCSDSVSIALYITINKKHQAKTPISHSETATPYLHCLNHCTVELGKQVKGQAE